MKTSTILIVTLLLIFSASANAFELSGQKTARQIYNLLNAAKGRVNGLHGWISNDCQRNKSIAKSNQDKVAYFTRKADVLYARKCTPGSERFRKETNKVLRALKSTCAPMSCNGHDYGRCNKQRKDIWNSLNTAQDSVRGFLNSCR